MVCISESNPNPNLQELPLSQPLNPHAAPYPPLPPAISTKMGPSWVLSKPYYRHQPVVYQLNPPPTLGYTVYAPSGEGSFMSSPPFWVQYPTNYRLYYYCYPKAVVDPTPALPAGLAPGGDQKEADRGTPGHQPPRFMKPGKRGSMVPKRSVPSGKRKEKVNKKEKEDLEVDLKGRTSLMIKNIPNHFGRNDLMVILDEHCLNENNKAMSEGYPIWSSYDFLYLPMDFRSRANLGYAFVNFTTEVAAKRFSVAFNEFKWKVSCKTCQVTTALIQGKEGFMNHFRNSVFPCHTNNYLPVVFGPPRDGATRSKPTPVGRRSSPARSSTSDWKRKAM